MELYFDPSAHRTPLPLSEYSRLTTEADAEPEEPPEPDGNAEPATNGEPEFTPAPPWS